MRTAALLLALAVPGSASAQFVAPFGVQYRPPAFYQAVWAQVAECAGTEPVAPLERVVWIAVPYIIDQTNPRRVILGVATPQEAVVRITWPAVWSPGVVAHEILHLFLPDAEESDPAFRRCDPLSG